MWEDFKEIGGSVIDSFFLHFGMIFILIGVMFLLMLLSEFEMFGLIAAGVTLILGIFFLFLGTSALERQKKRRIIAILIIWIGILLFFLSIFFLFFIWTRGISWSSSVAKQTLVPMAIETFCASFIFFAIGLFILKEKRGEGPAKKITGITKRNPILVLILTIITFGIYHLWWLKETRREINLCGADIPSIRLVIIPIIDLYFVRKYTEGFSHYVAEDRDNKFWFLLYILLWPVAVILIQQKLNKIAA
jgi:hypothetical protein